ncbi:peptidase S8/S53 domain-containing protein [Xylariomycetidae sp. FL2044]|nr:peptidase S8/S53 domain-containing protein [Xylariomycetidae sp. FL2044]
MLYSKPFLFLAFAAYAVSTQGTKASQYPASTVRRDLPEAATTSAPSSLWFWMRNKVPNGSHPRGTTQKTASNKPKASPDSKQTSNPLLSKPITPNPTQKTTSTKKGESKNLKPTGSLLTLKSTPTSKKSGTSTGLIQTSNGQSLQSTPSSKKQGTSTVPTQTSNSPSLTTSERSTKASSAQSDSSQSNLPPTLSSSTASCPSATGVAARTDGDSCETKAEWVVYPMEGQNKGQTDAIYKSMLALPLEARAINTSSSKFYGTLFWRVEMTKTQAISMLKTKNVATVYQPCVKSCYDPTTALIRQKDTSDDMVMIGQFGAKNEQGNIISQPLSWYQKNYVYDESAGKDVDVYIVDSGANLNHIEFNDLRSRVRWIHASPNVESVENDNGSPNRRGHGTCMLSRMGGRQYGVAKKANPVIVRIPTRYTIEDHLEAIKRIIDDVGDNNKRAVLSMSWYYPRRHPMTGQFTFRDADGNDGSEGHRRALRDMLRLLVSKGVTPVTGTGNDEKTEIDGFPADFGDPGSGSNYIPELIVFGATNADGTLMYPGMNRDAGRKLPHLHAPGALIKCATYNEDGRTYKGSSGTSPATAAGAGLAAYLLGLPQNGMFPDPDVSTPAKLKEYMLELAWARGDDKNMKSFYNGVRPSDAGTSGPVCVNASRQIPL